MSFASSVTKVECTHCKDLASPSSPLLCESHQIWNNFTHLFTCTNQVYLNYDTFGENGFKHVPGAYRLEYIPNEIIRAAHKCHICRQIDRACHEGGFGAAVGRVALYRPFLASSSWSRWKSLGIEKLDPSIIHCVLPVLLENRARSGFRTPAYLEISLGYAKTGIGLRWATRWDRSRLDLDLIKSWLTLCSNKHGSGCNTSMVPTALPSGCRFVDTFDRCVVYAPSSSVGFVALSYVWSSAKGGTDIELTAANQEQLLHPGSLPGDLLPTVIDDSIVLAKNLGFRFIWIDRLCIVQDDAASKHSQIESMDAIYMLAELTIVALATSDGLPGTPNRPRPIGSMTDCRDWHFWNRSQPRPDEDRVHIALPSFRLVPSSRWDSRGWTFQERVLSRRRLFISQDQALLCCGKVSINANVPREAGELELDSGRIDRDQGVQIRDIRTYTDFRAALQLYSTKQLSYQSDILNAFTGILKVLEHVFSTQFIHGHPESRFLDSLLWTPWRLDSEPRADAQSPSWSWPSWDGSIKTRHSFFPFEPEKQFVGDLVVYHIVDSLDPSGIRVLNQDPRWFDRDDDGPLVEATTVSREEDDWELISAQLWAEKLGLDEWRNCPHNPLEAAKHRDLPCSVYRSISDNTFNGALIFNTTLAYLRVVEPPPEDPRVARPDDFGLNRFEDGRFFLRNQTDEIVGVTMRMPTGWTTRNTPSGQSLHEFVVLGAGVTDLIEGERWPFTNNYSEWGIYVMLVEKTRVAHPACYRRIAVGIIAMDAWASCKPEWTTVILE